MKKLDQHPFRIVSDLEIDQVNGGRKIEKPIFTTLALGEEGGDFPTLIAGEDGWETTMAIGEEGGEDPDPII